MDIYKKIKVLIGEWGPGPGHYRLDDDLIMQDDDSIEVSESFVNRYKKVMQDYSQLMKDLERIQKEHLEKENKRIFGIS